MREIFNSSRWSMQGLDFGCSYFSDFSTRSTAFITQSSPTELKGSTDDILSL